MKAPKMHPDEGKRIEALNALEHLDTAAEERFDRITRLAQHLFGVEIALVSLVDSDRQWFKSAQGLQATETSREISFCGHAVADDMPLIVEDTALDDRFADNPLVTDDPNISFYAGIPIHAPGGLPVGTLCVIDSHPRAFSPAEQVALEDLASMAEAELARQRANAAAELFRERYEDAERRAATDALTRCWNRQFIMELLDVEFARAAREKTPFAVAMIDLDHFSDINNTHGHQVGDRVLINAAQRMRSTIRPYDTIGRYGGEEFLVVFPGCSARAAERVANRIIQQLAKAPVADGLTVTASIGIAELSTQRADSAALLKAADVALYEAKRGGRNRVCVNES